MQLFRITAHPEIDDRKPKTTRAERKALSNLPDAADGGAYYCDLGISYQQLEHLERRGLATSRNRSDWWRTVAGAEAVSR